MLTSVQLCKVSSDTTRASECKVRSGSASVLEHRFSISGICGLQCNLSVCHITCSRVDSLLKGYKPHMLLSIYGEYIIKHNLRHFRMHTPECSLSGFDKPALEY